MSVVIDFTASLTLSGDALPLLEGGGDDAGAERLGQDQRVADLDADVAENLVRMDHAGDRHAELDLLVDNAVAADDHRAAFFDLCRRRL